MTRLVHLLFYNFVGYCHYILDTIVIYVTGGTSIILQSSSISHHERRHLRWEAFFREFVLDLVHK